jgi:hypothetical protein
VRIRAPPRTFSAHTTRTFPAVTTADGGLPALVGTVFQPPACANGVTGAQITLVDGQGVHATTTIFLDCP